MTAAGRLSRENAVAIPLEISHCQLHYPRSLALATHPGPAGRRARRAACMRARRTAPSTPAFTPTVDTSPLAPE